MAQRKLRLFVIDKYLSYDIDGMLCVFAKDEEHAWEVLKEKDKDAYWYCDHLKFREVTEPEALVCWGGG